MNTQFQITSSQRATLQTYLDNNDSAGFYSTLHSYGDPYGRIGLGVTNDSTWQGQIANGFARSAAAREGVDLSYGSEAFNALNKDLAERYFNAIDTEGGDFPSNHWRTIYDIHDEAYKYAGLPITAWFPASQLDASSDPAGRWQDWMYNDDGPAFLGDLLEDGIFMVWSQRAREKDSLDFFTDFVVGIDNIPEVGTTLDYLTSFMYFMYADRTGDDSYAIFFNEKGRLVIEKKATDLPPGSGTYVRRGDNGVPQAEIWIGGAHNVVINEETGFAYPVGTARNDAFNGGVHFVDIQDPMNPIGVGGYGANGYTHDAQVISYTGPDADYTGKEIFIGANEDQIAIVDITDKSNPAEISTISYGQLSYTHQGWFTEDQRYFLLGDELDERDFGFRSRTLVFDMQDLDNPVLHTTYTGPTPAIDHNGYVLGNEFFLANYTAGLRVLDISQIGDEVITESGFFDTFPSNNATSFDGVWSVYPYFESRKILVNDINSGLFIVRKSN